jgi:hypothetical protein
MGFRRSEVRILIQAPEARGRSLQAPCRWAAFAPGGAAAQAGGSSLTGSLRALLGAVWAHPGHANVDAHFGRPEVEMGKAGQKPEIPAGQSASRDRFLCWDVRSSVPGRSSDRYKRRNQSKPRGIRLLARDSCGPVWLLCLELRPWRDGERFS